MSDDDSETGMTIVIVIVLLLIIGFLIIAIPKIMRYILYG